jgi:hypothetical protein
MKNASQITPVQAALALALLFASSVNVVLVYSCL